MKLFGLDINIRRAPKALQTPPPSEPVQKDREGRNLFVRNILHAAANSRLESSWTSTPSTVDSYIYQNWSRIVARSRDQVENNDYGQKYAKMAKDNIAGAKGFTLNSTPRDPDGTTIDTVAGKAIERAFAGWSRKGNYDVTGTLSRSDAERQAIQTAATDGEILAIKRYGKNAGPMGFALQFMDPVLLDPTHYEKTTRGTFIRHGIEFNEYNRPIAYHFKEADEQLVGYIQTTGRRTVSVPADQVIHAFVPEIKGQKRGLPWMRTSLGRMRMLGGFEDAALVNARVGASKMGFFKDLDATNEDDDDLPMEADPGTLENIGNRELVKWDPQFPDPFIGQFTSSMLRGISSGLNVSYHSLASDLTAVNFSSIRHGTLEEREAWKALQEWFVGAFCVPVFEAWLDYALLSQQITVAGKPLPFTKFDKFKDATFEGRRWQWIDPQAEVLANEVAVTMRSKSLSEVIRETSNRDPEDVWDEIEKEQAELKRRKIEVPLSVKYIDPNREAKNPQKTPPGPNA